MAADDEVPRSLTRSTLSNGGAAQIIFNASAGIAWKLTSLQCSAVALNALTASLFFLISATDSDGNTLIGSQPCPLENGAPAGAQSSFQWSGEAIGQIGASLTVGFTNANIQAETFVIATAVPI